MKNLVNYLDDYFEDNIEETLVSGVGKLIVKRQERKK